MRLFDRASLIVDHLFFAAALLPTFILLGALAVSLADTPASLATPLPPQAAACQGYPEAAHSPSGRPSEFFRAAGDTAVRRTAAFP